MKRAPSPTEIATRIGNRHRMRFPIGVIELMIAVALVALYLSWWICLLLAVLVHTLFPIWWDWPPFKKGPVRPYRPARLAGNVTIGLVIFSYGWTALCCLVNFWGWVSKPTSAWELDRYLDRPPVVEQLPGEIEKRWLIETKPASYLSLPREWQVALLPSVLATISVGLWAWLSCHEIPHSKRPRMLRSVVSSVRLIAIGCLVYVPSSSAQQPDEFTRRVRPVLESRCLRCHNDQSHKGGLSLATREASLKGGDTGPAIEPGKPDESLLIDAVRGPKPLMPKQGDPLKPDELAALRAWIESGAHWPQGLTLAERKTEGGPWWAIQPLKRPSAPGVSNTAWAHTPIDIFILAKLDEKTLAPRLEADRRTLIRRVTFDLTGLPPATEEVDAFMADSRPDAYERLVDRLLASPAYGERWARRWLDIVHYADTHGYDKDKRRDNAWPYRDYVVRAFNDDKPYDRFVREQIAGDALWPTDSDAVIATGFIAAGPWDFVGHVELAEGTVEKEKTRVIDRDDMVANTMSTFNSVTVHCARCHDHKFDPIPQRDYYQLQAVFAGVERGDRPYPTPEGESLRAPHVREREQAARQLEDLEQEERKAIGQSLSKYDAQMSGSVHVMRCFRKFRSKDPSPTNGYHSAIAAKPDTLAWVQVDLGSSVPVDEIRLVPSHPTDFRDTPEFGLPLQFRVEASESADLLNPTLLLVKGPTDVGPSYEPTILIRPQNLKARYVRVTATRLWDRGGDYVFALAELEVMSGGKNVAAGAHVSALDSIEQGRWSKQALVDGFDSRASLAYYGQDYWDAAFSYQEAWHTRQAIYAKVVSPDLRERLAAARQALAKIDHALEQLPPGPPVYAAVSGTPRVIRVLERGEVERPAETVHPGALACVPELESNFPDNFSEGENRTALSNWVARPKNVLTWRSIANRVWQFHFGKGLVDTPNDFGRNGSAPTHPELLDWMAVELLENGGSLKALQRQIVLSATYRQSSEHDEHAAALDAENRLLWRQNRRRLEAEEMRDTVLAVAGTLDRRMGGPGFEVFRFKDDHSPIYDHEDKSAIVAPGSNRRAVYRFIVRSVPNPWIECLDGADPNANVPARNVTITPLQSLALLNDPFMIQQAQQFAERLKTLEIDASRQIDFAMRMALGRHATDDERATLSAYAQKHGMAAACRLMFNLNEFMFID